MEDLRYPVGRYHPPSAITPALRARWIAEIEQAPHTLRQAVSGLTNDQLDQSYREGGWTIRQVVHHIADSHMNSFVRFKLAVTEDSPAIKTYDEKRWAELEDAAHSTIEISLRLIEALHQRWVIFLRSLDESQFKRCFLHPELGTVSLNESLALYAWHGRHHVAHITNWRERAGLP